MDNIKERLAQLQLKQGGYYTGVIDGDWGPLSKGAAAEWAKQQEPKPEPIPVNERFDNRTEENLATMQPQAQKLFRSFLRHAIPMGAEMGVVVKLICGFRNKKDQEDAKRRGTSRAGWAYSWHNHGWAGDLGLFQGNSYVDGDNPKLAMKVYRKLRELANEMGLNILGEWDPAHFQIPSSRSTPTAADRAKLLSEGKWWV